MILPIDRQVSPNGDDSGLKNHANRPFTPVVSTRLSPCIFTLQTLITDHGVHDALLEDVTHMQTTGDGRGGIMMQKLSWL